MREYPGGGSALAIVWRREKLPNASALSIQLPPPTTAPDGTVFCHLAFWRIDLAFMLKEKRRIAPFSMTAKLSIQFRSLDFLPTPSRWCLCLRMPSFAHGAPASSRLSSSSKGTARKVSSPVSPPAASSRMMA